jgi:hypothetical protein
MFPFHRWLVPVPVPCTAGSSEAAGLDAPAERDGAIRRLLRPWKEEVRQTVDGRQSYYPSRGGLPEPSPQLVQLSLADALRHVASGSIEPRDLLRQLPADLRVILEKVAQDRYKRRLDALSSDECRALCGMLSGAFAAAAAGSASGAQSASRRATWRSRSWRAAAWAVGLAAAALAVTLAAWRWLA